MRSENWDEPLLSPVRAWNGFRLWYHYRLGGVELSLWNFIVYQRRPYAAHKKGKY